MRFFFFSFLPGYNILELVEIFQNRLEILEHLPYIKINGEGTLSEVTGVRNRDFGVLGSTCGSALLFSLKAFICFEQKLF